MASYKENLLSQINDLNDKKKYQKSLRLIQDYRKTHPLDIPFMLEEMNVYMKLHRYDDAKEVSQKVVEKSNNDDIILRALANLAVIETVNGNCESALSLHAEYIDKNKNDLCIASRCSMSDLYCRLGDYEKAFEIINIGVNNLEICNAKATIHFYKHEYDKCLEVLNDICFEQEKGNEAVIANYTMKANVSTKLGRIDDSIEYRKLALKNSYEGTRSYYDTKLLLASSYQGKNNIEAAIKECEDVLKYSCEQMDPNNVDCVPMNYASPRICSKANSVLGNIYISIHDIENAYKRYSQCQDNERNIGYAKAAYYKGAFEEALKIVSSIEVPKNNQYLYRDVHILTAQILFRLGRYRDFANEYYKVINNGVIGGLKAYNDDTYSMEFMRIYAEKFHGVKIYSDYQHIGKYAYNQIVHYDPAKAIEHIKEGHTGNIDANTFDKDIDIDDLFAFVQEHLSECERKFSTSSDIYLMDLKKLDCPYSDGLIEIMCRIDSYDILTMYPLVIRERYDKVEEAKVRSKRNVDKFNKKYGL